VTHLADYAGAELAAMAEAHNYYRWIGRHCRPFLRGTVVEFGAGTGNFSAHLLQETVERLMLVEPSANLVDVLSSRFAGESRVETRSGVLQQFADDFEARVDVVIIVNVLEHIEDDVDVLRAACRMLRSGGHLILFVPAFPFLYGSLDTVFGHVRRYTKRTLIRTLTASGFTPLTLRYLNILGVLPWLLTGRVLRRTGLDPRSVALADRTMIPLTAALERLFEPPVGQSLFAVAGKSAR
jgi:SAM-dependent methyltransferase